jgi:signal peptidase
MDKYVIAALFFAVATIILSLTPATFAYAQTDSMEPEISPGDTFILYPSSEYQVGDVIAFVPEDGGTIITHRIVEETEEGYITKGDNNQITDQSGGDRPPVTENRIRGKALTLGGEVATVPYSGWLLNTINQNKIIIYLLIILVLLYDLTGEYKNRKTFKRDYIDYGDVLTYLIILLIIISNTVILLPVSEEITLIATEGNSSAETSIKVGQREDIELSYESKINLPFTRDYVKSSDMEITDYYRDENNNIIIEGRSKSYDEIGAKDADLRIYNVPASLPKPVSDYIFNINAILGSFITTLSILLPLYLILYLLLPTESPVRFRKYKSLKEFI